MSTPVPRMLPPSQRVRLVIGGAVQGVGFRPFIYRLAEELGLRGWVGNSAAGVGVEAEGPRAALEAFLARLPQERPPGAFIQSLETIWLDPAGYTDFQIRPSSAAGPKTVLVRPDVATCADCLREILDPADRRFHYPFTNCTHCGPRFTILEALPYDRPNTSMRHFTMCPACQAEYDDPRDRRFHAQPNACPACGPHLELWDRSGKVRATHSEALRRAVEAIGQEAIVAVKGLGGFHLMVAAQSEAAVRRLRERKHREEKPLALMFPGLDAVRGCCEIAPLEERLLASPEAPIVLLRRRRHPGGGRSAAGEAIAGSVAPANPYLGVMLPYTPLHHLLLGALGRPVVATSGNLSDEPICIAEHEAVDRLGGMADLFLVHNRPIVRHVDDSIVREVAGREMVLRRARGYAPLPIALAPTPAIPAATAGRSGPAEATPAPTPVVLAVGAHLKNTVALAVGPRVFLSQHIGDLETVEALRAFRRVLSDFPRLYAVAPAVVVADTHPDYVSRKEAQGLRLPLQAVQHHYAHVLACLAENELAGPVLGVAWDGTGYGADGTIWGGEFLLSTRTTFERVAWLRPFPLPGGDRAVHEPRRAALGLLHEAYGERAFARAELATLQAFRAAELPALQGMLAAGLRCPRTSSVGRLFDAVASLAGLRQLTHYEGQAAMELEFALPHDASHRAYPLPLVPARRRSAGARAAWVLDWVPLLEALLVDLQARTAIGEISARFHNALTEAVVNVARQTGQNQVALTGGCFQNLYLLECVVARLQAEGFRPYWHQRVPPNDGGIALGQAVAGLSAAAGGGNR